MDGQTPAGPVFSRDALARMWALIAALAMAVGLMRILIAVEDHQPAPPWDGYSLWFAGFAGLATIANYLRTRRRGAAWPAE